MLNINNIGSTNVTVTLYEMTQNKINPNYLWSIQRKGSNDIINFTAPDISTAPYYWNEFVITVATNSVGLTNGIIPIKEGEWIYNVYETNEPYNLVVGSAIGLLENGLIVCGLTYSITSTPISATAIRPITVFRPE